MRAEGGMPLALVARRLSKCNSQSSTSERGRDAGPGARRPSRPFTSDCINSCTPPFPPPLVCARQPHTSTDTLDTVFLVVARLRRCCRRSPPRLRPALRFTPPTSPCRLSAAPCPHLPSVLPPTLTPPPPVPLVTQRVQGTTSLAGPPARTQPTAVSLQTSTGGSYRTASASSLLPPGKRRSRMDRVRPRTSRFVPVARTSHPRTSSPDPLSRPWTPSSPQVPSLDSTRRR